MAFVMKDRVMELSTTTGSGALTLAGAYTTGFRAFSSVMSNADTTRVFVEAVDANANPSGDWFVGPATYSSGTLTLGTPEASSTGSAITWAAGNKRVVMDASAAYLASLTSTTGLLPANNLSDVSSAATSRTNLGLLRLVSFFFTTTPTASEVLALYVAADAFTLPANLSGSKVNVGTNATATFALDLQQNGTTIGTISIATSGTATLTTTSGTAKSVAVGDVLKVVAPATPDTTIANVAINIKGTL
jgi:hypothetical protein